MLLAHNVCGVTRSIRNRDAYDHLMRVFALPMKEIEKLDVDKYVLDNVKKAFSHEYRAFFDTADWFTYICRK